MSAERLRQAAALMRERARKASPSPWGDNSYAAVFSGPAIQQDEDFWTDERLADEHSYDRRIGQTCPACGPRPVLGKDGNEEPGRFYWDCARHKEAYDLDPVVASVPAQYGDTATGRHRADAAHIASWHPAVALAVADWLEEEADSEDDTRANSIRGLEGFIDAYPGPAHAVANAYLGDPS